VIIRGICIKKDSLLKLIIILLVPVRCELFPVSPLVLLYDLQLYPRLRLVETSTIGVKNVSHNLIITSLHFPTANQAPQFKIFMARFSAIYLRVPNRSCSKRHFERSINVPLSWGSGPRVSGSP
jgi:hypothetical protein